MRDILPEVTEWLAAGERIAAERITALCAAPVHTGR